MGSFEIDGADQFLALSKALKKAGQTTLRKELNKGLHAGAKPLIPKARAAAREKIPKRGGLAAVVAKAPIRVQVRTGKDPGVRIVVGNKGGGARGTNVGTVRHPVFGTQRFVAQAVPEATGWFDGTMRREAPSIRPVLEQALERVAATVVREAR